MVLPVGPTTHITGLAHAHEYFCIQMVDPWELRDALDRSTDLRHDLGETMDEDFPILLMEKIEACSEWYLTNLAFLGIQEPLVVIIRSDGHWQMDEGHHRLAWALLNNKEVPVIFDDTGADDESHMAYLVARQNVEAYHYTVPADAALVSEVEEALAPVEDSVFIPSQRRGRHRAGGRHRMDA